VMISTRSVGLLIDTVVCLTLAKWETVSGRFGGYFTTFLSLILWFAPKATANLKLIFETTTPLFHALGVGGGPIWIGTPPNGPLS
jgi:hypothetical protein